MRAWGVATLVVFIAIAGAAGAPSAPRAIALARAGDSSSALSVGGQSRTYDLHVPPAYDGKAPLPLVLALHGGGGTGKGMPGLTHLSALADRKGFIVVYPDGIQRRWADGRGTTVADRNGIDDVGFLAALVAKLASELAVDPHRVYATGISNGGFMSQRLACELSGTIAAVAVVAATMGEALAARCEPTRPVPLLLIHGTKDPLVPWDGGQVTIGAGGRILSVAATIQKWVTLNGCAPTATVTLDPEDPTTGTRIRREVYGQCKDGAEVILFAVDGGGHTWPGGPQYLPERFIGKTNRTLDASEAIWEFFRRHPKP